MAFTYEGARGDFGTSSSGTTTSVDVTSNISAGQLVIVHVVSDNDGTLTFSGDITGLGYEHLSVSDDQGNTYTELQQTLHTSGSAGDGVVTSLWYSVLDTGLTTAASDSIYCTHDNAVSARGIAVFEYSVGGNVSFDTGDRSYPHGNGTQCVSGISGLSSGTSYLAVGCVGIENKTNVSITQDTTPVASDYTNIGNEFGSGTAGAGTSNVAGQACHYIISSDTAAWMYSTISSSSDYAGAFAALEETTGATISMGTLSFGGQIKTSTLSPGAVSKAMDTLMLQGLPFVSSVGTGAVQMTMNTLAFASQTETLSLSTGAVQLPLDMLALSSQIENTNRVARSIYMDGLLLSGLPKSMDWSVYKTDPNLVSLWNFEQSNLGRDLKNRNHLTNNNSVTQNADSKELAYSSNYVNASHQYLSITDANQTGLDITGDFSFGGWVKVADFGAPNDRHIGGKWLIGTNTRCYELAVTSNGGVEAGISSDGTAQYKAITNGSLISAGTWYHIYMTYDGSQIVAYIDAAVPGGTNPLSYSSGVNDSVTTSFNLARMDGATTRDMDGRMDEIAFFDRALSPHEIKSIYNNGIQGGMVPLYTIEPQIQTETITIDTITIINVVLNLLSFAGSSQTLADVVPGAVSLPMDTLNLIGQTETLSVTAGAVQILLSMLAMIAATETLSIDTGAVQIPLNLLTALGQVNNLTVSTGAVSIPLDIIPVNTDTQTLTISTGAIQKLMDTLALTCGAETQTVNPGAVQKALNLLTLSAEAESLTISAGIQILMDLLGLSGSPQALAVDTGGVQLLMDLLSMALETKVITLNTGAVQMAMDTLNLQTLTQPLTVTPGTVAIGLGLLELISNSENLSVSPGAVQAVLDLLAASGTPLDITVQNITGVSVLLNLLSLAAATQNLSVATGAVQTPLNTLSFSGNMPSPVVDTSVAILMNLIEVVGAVPATQVSPGAVTIPIDLLSVTNVPPVLSISPGAIQVLADTLALIGSAETLTVVIGSVPVVIPISMLALSNQTLQATLAPGAASVDLTTLQIAALVESALIGAIIQILLSTLAIGTQTETSLVVPGSVSMPLSNLALGADILATAVTPGGVTIPLDTLLANAEAKSILIGQITTILMNMLSAGASAPDIAITPGGIGVQLGTVYLIPSAEKLTVYIPPLYAGADIEVSDSGVTLITTEDDGVTLITTEDGGIYVITVGETTRFN